MSLILTYHHKWRDYFVAQPEHYEERPGFDVTGVHIYVIAVRRPGAPFLADPVQVAADFNRLDLVLTNATADAVLPYNWDTRLRAAAPAEVFPYELEDGFTLLGIRPHGATNVTIHFRSPL